MGAKSYYAYNCKGCLAVVHRRADQKYKSPYCIRCFSVYTHTKHGDAHSRLYKIWQGMKDRCKNGHKDYGGRGIGYCQEWEWYLPFKEWAMSNGYSEGLTLDRIDTNGNYKPSNCRWSTPEEQSHNRRNGLTWEKVKEIREVCHIYLHSDLAEKYSVSKATIGLVANNKIWVDPNYVPTHRHRWSKIRCHIPRP